MDLMEKVRTALDVGGPTFVQTHDPCPKGWDYDPRMSHELAVMAVECGITVLWDCLEGELRYQGLTKMQVEGKVRRRPVADYLRRQGRFDHFVDEDLDFFQSRIDEMWEEWILPGVLAPADSRARARGRRRRRSPWLNCSPARRSRISTRLGLPSRSRTTARAAATRRCGRP
jgi:hypothetical protein